MSNHLYQHLETLWQFMQMGHVLQPADVIIVPGSNDTRVAEVACHLYQQGLAPWVLFSGNVGRFTQGLFDQSEAETFAQIAKECGLPSDAILIEPQATHSGENVLLSYQLLKEKGIKTERILVAHKPYMERRAYATFMKQWPEQLKLLQVTSSSDTLFDYLTEDLTLDFIIQALVEDFERIQHYPAQGFQIEQMIPDDVLLAHQALKPLTI
ncbi:YdcF family protein [Vibrio sp. V27_P1S3P104]|uniref:YdcF family protein n=1 Tax=Vibrio TaxID=662 RepID=UPI000C1719D6|nr:MULTISPECIES: YdcF family protein [Vibrio]NAW68444.1 YdcF family protein [Vibrio sp. V28_P6S34P95]NAX04813.1 YdcF family protein [Vibrio sp. V30_P3S12P165]NAX33474.1 YdcF family protein [Vibrio sp. V29_P1S30P107]NAX36963.1 YdcF family protein [Vibrio sp. V27_P1S3P104]NAX39566.1 YdcF family protein [Vibrio sp. V26_P1S5P106]